MRQTTSQEIGDGVCSHRNRSWRVDPGERDETASRDGCRHTGQRWRPPASVKW